MEPLGHLTGYLSSHFDLILHLKLALIEPHIALLLVVQASVMILMRLDLAVLLLVDSKVVLLELHLSLQHQRCVGLIHLLEHGLLVLPPVRLLFKEGTTVLVFKTKEALSRVLLIQESLSDLVRSRPVYLLTQLLALMRP